MKAETKSSTHEFDTERWCPACPGVYHYTCVVCGQDCTMGEPAGPTTKDTDGVRRCRECYGLHSQARARLSAAAPDLLAWMQAFVATLDHHNAEVKLSFTGSALNEDILSALVSARAAIAKAKGA